MVGKVVMKGLIYKVHYSAIVHGSGLSCNCIAIIMACRPAAYMSLLQAEFLGVSSFTPSLSKERSDDGLVPAKGL